MDVVYDPAQTDTLFNPVRRVYLFYGEDEVLADEALSILQRSTSDPAFTDFDLERIDAETTPVDQIITSANLAPFASPFRLVIVRGAGAFRRRDRHADAEKLAQAIGGLGSRSCLALRAASDDDGRTKTALTPKLDAAIREHGILVRCRALVPEALADWLVAEAASAGKKLDRRAAELLARAGNGDRTALGNELEKAICYAGESSAISVSMVEAICSFDAEDVMFKLVDAVGHRNADRAIFLFRELQRFDSKPHSVSSRLLAMISRQIRLIWQARELAQCGIDSGRIRSLPPEIVDDLPSEASIAGMAWKAGDLFRMARQWNSISLRLAFRKVVEADLANKGGEEGSTDPIINLELLILSLCGTK